MYVFLFAIQSRCIHYPLNLSLCGRPGLGFSIHRGVPHDVPNGRKLMTLSILLSITL